MGDTPKTSSTYQTALRALVNLRHLFTGQTTSGLSKVGCLYCLRDRGIVGGTPSGGKAAGGGTVAFLPNETFESLQEAKSEAPPLIPNFACNIVIEGVELLQLIGREFQIQGVRFRGIGQYLLDGSGGTTNDGRRIGILARIVTDGWLHPGPSEMLVWT